MSAEALMSAKTARIEAGTLVSPEFTGKDRRNATFLLTCSVMARDALASRQGIKEYFDYAVGHQSEFLSLAHQFDKIIENFDSTAGGSIDSKLINTTATRAKDKLGPNGQIPPLLGSGEVRPHEAVRQLEAGNRALTDQNCYMNNSELAESDAALLEKIQEAGEWSRLHLDARSPKHFLATFMIDVYPMMLRRTGSYRQTDTDELVRALCENVEPGTEFFRLIREQGWLTEPDFSPEFIKDAWLKELSGFIVDANTHTWAAEGAEVQPQRPGYKELQYPQSNPETGKIEGDFELRDSYTGYFRAPGMTTVYYKGHPAWAMAYGGKGMEGSWYPVTKPTFKFLMNALMQVTPELPYRGPKEYVEGNRKYEMEVDGTIEDFHGNEKISEGREKTFSQIFFGGIVIGKTSERTPIYPWNR